jgi:hypothetical protein
MIARDSNNYNTKSNAAIMRISAYWPLEFDALASRKVQDSLSEADLFRLGFCLTDVKVN